MNCYKYRVYNIKVDIHFECYEYYAYFEKEFCSMPKHDDTGNISVNVVNMSYELPSSAKQLSKDVWNVDGVIALRLKAFDRYSWSVYSKDSDRWVINLYIDYPVRDYTHKLINPFYEERWKACLSDFFHNPFLSILEIAMLEQDCTLFHCSSFTINEKNIVLTGCGQTGKSTIVSTLIDQYKVSVNSEDFSFVSNKGYIYGYLHQTRVKQNKEHSLFCNYSSVIDNFFNILNILSYKILRYPVARHYSVKDYFSNAEILADGKIDQIIILERKTQKKEKVVLPKIDMSTICMRIIEEEFGNIVLFKELADCLYKIGITEYDYRSIMDKTEIIYRQIIKETEVYALKLPMYPNVNTTANELYKIINS